MTNKFLIVVTTALIVANGAMGANAHQNRSTPRMQNQEQPEQGPPDQRSRAGMMGMMGQGMMAMK
jgi:hypothetical protein